MIDHGDQAYFPGEGRQTTGTPSRVLQLREGTDLIVRADGQLQFGTVPEVARVLSLPTGVGVEQIHQVMQELRRSMPDATVIRLLGHCGLPAVHARGIVEELLKAGFLSARPTELSTRVHVLGHSTLSRAVLSQLRGLGIPASGTAPGIPSFGRLCEDDLVVLAGMLFPPADISYHLMDMGAAHLTCGAVDSRVAIGPLILPGQTPCLACLDATYLAEDAQWRTVRSRVTEVMAPQGEQVIALTGSLTATTVREILARRGTSTDGRTWLVPDLLRGRHYFDPLTLKVTGTLPTRQPGCPCCALAPDAVR